MVYVTLFLSSLISATVFPIGSEALLIYDIEIGHSLFWLVTVATIGNTMGAIINYWFGLGGEVLLKKRGLIDSVKFQKFKDYFGIYGGWSLLLSWMPFIGDLFTFAAGIAKYSFLKFMLLVFIAKLGRYLVLTWGWIYLAQ